MNLNFQKHLVPRERLEMSQLVILIPQSNTFICYLFSMLNIIEGFFQIFTFNLNKCCCLSKYF